MHLILAQIKLKPFYYSWKIFAVMMTMKMIQKKIQRTALYTWIWRQCKTQSFCRI